MSPVSAPAIAIVDAGHVALPSPAGRIADDASADWTSLPAVSIWAIGAMVTPDDDAADPDDPPSDPPELLLPQADTVSTAAIATAKAPTVTRRFIWFFLRSAATVSPREARQRLPLTLLRELSPDRGRSRDIGVIHPRASDAWSGMWQLCCRSVSLSPGFR